MKNKATSGFDLLQSLLRLLVNEWGGEAVKKCLDEISLHKNASEVVGGFGGVIHERNKKNPSAKKPTAVLIASRANLPPEKKDLIITIAERYDEKTFLPSQGDVKFFFEAYGEGVPHVRQRIDAFRTIIRLLSGMTEGALRNILENSIHSGPASLDSLSDAMRGAGERRQNLILASSESEKGGDEKLLEALDDKEGESKESSEGTVSDY